MILLHRDKNQTQCNACHSYDDVKCIKSGLTIKFMNNVALCKACRSLLHKRLHEEELDNDKS